MSFFCQFFCSLSRLDSDTFCQFDHCFLVVCGCVWGFEYLGNGYENGGGIDVFGGMGCVGGELKKNV